MAASEGLKTRLPTAALAPFANKREQVERRGGGPVLLARCGFAKSTSEARRLVQQNAVSLGERTITDINETLTPQGGEVLRAGKRRFGKIVVG